MQHSQYFNHIVADLIDHDVVRMHDVLTGARHATKAMDALEGADALVIVTEWKEFRGADLDAIKQKLKTPLVFDGRNLYDPKFARSQGINYLPIGR